MRMTTELETGEKEIEAKEAESHEHAQLTHRKIHPIVIKSGFILLIFAVGLGSGFFMGRMSMKSEIASAGVLSSNEAKTSAAPTTNSAIVDMTQINPPGGYKIPAVFGDIGPQMVAVGAIDLAKFIDIYRQQNKPLTDEQMSVLTKEVVQNVVINSENAYFLLNFFWALGLTNQNTILTEGPMMSGGIDKVGGFASTGGWTIGAKRSTELYASTKILSLTDEQQARLLEVASVVYRPCCNNPTHFPDCNHGMAMLGLLELMASQGANADQMYDSAKYVTAFWYPQQMSEVAAVFKVTQNVDFAQADARQVVSSKYSSGTGFQTVHQWLASNGMLEQAPDSSGSCGVQ
jgi:hypothetical protein